MFGINGWEFVVLAVVALVVIGPDKLPGFISEAGRMVRQLRRMASEAQADVREHLGPEFADIDLSELNPRAFVQKHLLDDALDDDLRSAFDLDGDAPSSRSTGATARSSGSPDLRKRDAPDLRKPGAPDLRKDDAPDASAYADGDVT
ncbi:sec-independent protein translocase protein TatB [Motilibacter peucedani]|uniref:Sec-independent protein translocase protein TatB n=1 Tax=Motilibacter peucedani TaxID=598650 RepID=A0A420XME2_9ACTN|nr:sec-independent translocase [Motilibacter peucedani]RKS72467.1 sec-independent protein translocase protein TatB [Motilibacter peucedani]